MEARGEINGMRSLDGVYGPLIRRARTVKGVHVDLVQAEEYYWRVGGEDGRERESCSSGLLLQAFAPPLMVRERSVISAAKLDNFLAAESVMTWIHSLVWRSVPASKSPLTPHPTKKRTKESKIKTVLSFEEKPVKTLLQMQLCFGENESTTQVYYCI